MANIEAELRGLLLNAVELKEISGWPEALVEDYLNIIENIINMATAVDIDIIDLVDTNNQIATLQGNVGKLMARINNIIKMIENILQLQSVNMQSSKNRANINKQQREINKQQRQINDFEQLLYVG